MTHVAVPTTQSTIAVTTTLAPGMETQKKDALTRQRTRGKNNARKNRNCTDAGAPSSGSKKEEQIIPPKTMTSEQQQGKQFPPKRRRARRKPKNQVKEINEATTVVISQPQQQQSQGLDTAALESQKPSVLDVNGSKNEVTPATTTKEREEKGEQEDQEGKQYPPKRRRGRRTPKSTVQPLHETQQQTQKQQNVTLSETQKSSVQIVDDSHVDTKMDQQPQKKHRRRRRRRRKHKADYPDSLIAIAHKNMSCLQTLEQEWKDFVTNEEITILSFEPQNSEMSKVGIDYSKFWRFSVESSEVAVKKDVSFVKSKDSTVPSPLLSEAFIADKDPVGNSDVEVDDVTTSVHEVVITAVVSDEEASKEEEEKSDSKAMASLDGTLEIVKDTLTVEKTAKQINVPATVSHHELTKEEEKKSDSEPMAPDSKTFNLVKDAATEKKPAKPKNLYSTVGLPLSITPIPNSRVVSSNRFSALDRERPQRLNLQPRTIPRELPELAGNRLRRIQSDNFLAQKHKDTLAKMKKGAIFKNSTADTTTAHEAPASLSRFGRSHREHDDRPRLNLAPRTIPRELPEFQRGYQSPGDLRRIQSDTLLVQKLRVKNNKMEKMSVLLSPIKHGVSDDDESDISETGLRLPGNDGDESSEWEVGDGAYDSSDVEN